MVLTEAFAAGTPVLASNIAGYADVVTDGHDGVLVPPADPQRLAEELQAFSLAPDRLDPDGRRRARVRAALRVAAGRGRRSRASTSARVSVPEPADAPRPCHAPRRPRRPPTAGRPCAHGGCRRSTPSRRAAPSRHRTARRIGLGVAAIVGLGLTFIAARRIGVDQVVASIVRSDISWVLIATGLMMASMFLRASAWFSIAKAALPRSPAAPPRRRLGDDGRGADVGDPAGAPRRAGARDGARPAHRAGCARRCRSCSGPWSRSRCSTSSRSCCSA